MDRTPSAARTAAGCWLLVGLLWSGSSWERSYIAPRRPLAPALHAGIYINRYIYITTMLRQWIVIFRRSWAMPDAWLIPDGVWCPRVRVHLVAQVAF
jgi:hypothetical protein